MLQLGNNITSANDPLKKIDTDELFRMISKPDADLKSRIHQLRTVQTIDQKRYQSLKRMLPYVTCGIFSPPYRRLENFASIDCFMLDIDHLHEKEISMESLCKRLSEDNRIEMFFISPGSDGVKVLFNLSEKCYDKAMYSMFYKLFIKEFSMKYGLQQVIDKVTSDATRACFLSHDPDAYHNPFSEPVQMASYINFDNSSEVEQAKKDIAEYEQASQILVNKETAKLVKNELTADLLVEIKKKLNPNFRKKKPKEYYVPPQLDDALHLIKEKFEALGIELVGNDPIHYGRKLRFCVHQKWAQLNIFYGKSGFKIVKTPVNGSDKDLNEIAYQILCEIFY